MKKIIATILVLLMIMTTAYATATFECNNGIIGSRNIDESVSGRVSSYVYNGNKYSFTVNDTDFKKLNQIFSDENLINSNKSFNEPVTGEMSDFPKDGKYTIKEIYDADNKYSISLEFSFDEKGVLLSEIFISNDSVNHKLRQGYYTYKNNDIYNEIKNILDEYAKNDEEKLNSDKYELKENESKISDLKILYTASFTDEELSVNGDNKWLWGICRYKYESGATVTRAYLSLLEDGKGTKYFLVSEVDLKKNNTIYFSGDRDIIFYENENFGKENRDSEVLYVYNLQINVSDSLEIESVVYSQTHKYTNASQTIDIDMNKYTGNKTLPTIQEFQFLSKNNKSEIEAKEDRPVITINENGDEVVKVGGTNLDDVKKEILQNVDLMEEDSYVKIVIDSDKENFETEHRYTTSSSKNQMKNFVEGLFEELYLQTAGGTVTSVSGNSHCNIKIRYKENGKWVLYNTTLHISDSAVMLKTENNGDIMFNVRNTDAILDYLSDYSKNKFTTYKTETTDESTPHVRGSIDGLTKTDVIEFEFKLPADTDNSISKEVASPGKTVKGTFERYKENKYRSTYILTLSGNLGTISLCKETQSSLSGEEEIFSNNIPVAFLNTIRYEDANIVEYKVGKDSGSYDFKMVFKSGDISEVYFEDVKCTDLKYTQLTEDTKLSDEFVEKDKEAILREAQECADTLYEFGLFKGTDKGYELEKSLTREESATILVRLLGEEDKVKADDFDEVFVDVDKDRWSYAYVMYCYKHNITKGTGADTFSPDVQIDANQFITLMMRLLGYTEVNPDTALEKSVEYKLLPEEKIDELTKKKVFTRSDMVQIVYNSLKTQMDDETVFADYLLEKGILTEKEIEQIK